MTRSPAPRVVVIGGPNGAGKTTYSKSLLSTLGVEHFVNADVLAQGLSGLNPASAALQAGRIMLKRLCELADANADFAFESTLSSRSFAPFLKGLQRRGYHVELYYLALASPQLASKRVQLRVKMGGHNIPAEVILRRFYRSLANLYELYLPLADAWTVFDNADTKSPAVIALKSSKSHHIAHQSKWQRLQEMAHSAA